MKKHIVSYEDLVTGQLCIPCHNIQTALQYAENKLPTTDEDWEVFTPKADDEPRGTWYVVYGDEN